MKPTLETRAFREDFPRIVAFPEPWVTQIWSSDDDRYSASSRVGNERIKVSIFPGNGARKFIAYPESFEHIP